MPRNRILPKTRGLHASAGEQRPASDRAGFLGVDEAGLASHIDAVSWSSQGGGGVPRRLPQARLTGAPEVAARACASSDGSSGGTSSPVTPCSMNSRRSLISASRHMRVPGSVPRSVGGPSQSHRPFAAVEASTNRSTSRCQRRVRRSGLKRRAIRSCATDRGTRRSPSARPGVPPPIWMNARQVSGQSASAATSRHNLFWRPAFQPREDDRITGSLRRLQWIAGAAGNRSMSSP